MERQMDGIQVKDRNGNAWSQKSKRERDQIAKLHQSHGMTKIWQIERKRPILVTEEATDKMNKRSKR